MTWWAWVLLWTALVAGAATVVFQLVRALWRKSVALFDELGTAADRLAVLDEELTTLTERTTPGPDLAVFADPTGLRQARVRAGSERRVPGHRRRHRAADVRHVPGTPRAS